MLVVIVIRNKMNKILLVILICVTNTLFSQEVDTLTVSQNDTLVFNINVSWIQRPCQKPKWNTSYKLKAPKDSTYYLIFNDTGQLVEEGLYTSKYTIDNKHYSGFYNSKYYYYKDNGKLSRVYYQKNGRNVKTEYYKRGKLKEMRLSLRNETLLLTLCKKH